MPIVSFYSDLHPYECGQNCVHCRKAVEGEHDPFTCAFCNEDLDGLIPIERQLLSRGEFDVFHSGQEYGVFCDGEAATEYLKDEVVLNSVAYRFKLTGAHAGPPIEVLMVEPQWEGDSYGGVYYCWRMLLWADDHAPFDHDYFDDAYTDPLRDELTELAKSWD